ncbi:MAG: hypothetical protein ACRDX9_05380 [Acidimicrobiia bacterium]
MSEERDREIIVTDTRSGGSNFGAIIAGVIIAIALIFGVWYLVNNTDDGETLPDEVNVTIDQESGGE